MNFDAVWTLIVLLLLAALFHGPWQELCTAYARQIAFECRDRIFDLAVDGKLDFQSEEYRTIRSSMEMLIRFAHELTLLNFIYITWCLGKRRHERSESHLTVALNTIRDQDTLEQVRACVNKAHLAMLIMMIAKSPLTSLLLLVLPLTRRAGSTLGSRLRSFVSPWGEVLQVEAENAPVNTGARKLAA